MLVRVGWKVFKSTSPAIYFSWAVFIKALLPPGRARDLIAGQGDYLFKINFISCQVAGALPTCGYLYSSGRSVLLLEGETSGFAV